MLLALLLLAGLPAQAAKNYTFPGALPPGCVNLLNGNYMCGSLTLSDGDTVTIAAPKSATITFSGAFTVGSGTQINAAGATADLTINALAAVTIGPNTNLNGNVISSAAVNTGNNSTINGYILTTLPTGVVTIGNNNVIGGYIRTDAGAVTVGPGSTVSDSISTAAGVVALGVGSTVKGSVSTDAGAITTGTDVMITGSIGTQVDATRAGIGSQAGVITIGARNNIQGKLSTNAGAITVGADSIIGGAASPTGVITLGDRVTSGDIISGAGAINIGNNALLCGKVEAYGAGVVTLTTNVKIDGSISTTAGAITVGAGSNIGGDVSITGAGVLTMTQVLVAGNVSTVAGAITLTGSKVRGSVTASGAGVVTLTNTSQNDPTFSVVAACAAAPVPTAATVAVRFDALETGIPWNPAPAARNPLYTKLVGTAFSFDIAALKTDLTLESAYVASGALSKYVKLELFDFTGAACSAYVNPVAVQTATFTSATYSGAPGRTLSGAFTLAEAHRSLLVRIKECTDSACTSVTNVAPACSSDRFSVRPPALTLSTTTATASPTIRAGTDFTLLAKTNPGGGYAGVLTLDSSKLTTQLPSQGASAQSGGSVGVLTPSTLTANATTATAANYSEVGYLYLGPGTYRDDDFTRVDSNFGDCITSTANNDYLADTLNGGKYGCSIGNKLAMRLGRFIPNHFSTGIVSSAVMPCPAALIAAGLGCPPAPNPGFVYSRQPFAVTVTALSASGTPTLNYSGLLARDVMLEAWSAPGSVALQNPPLAPTGSALGYSPVISTEFAQGVASVLVTYTFPAHYPQRPLAAPTDIHLRVQETGLLSDGVTSLRPAPLASSEAGIKVVSGRLHVANNYGSELLPLPIVVHAQYWDGTRFVNSTTDQKTSFGGLNVTPGNCKKNMIVAGNCMALSITTPVPPLMIDGQIRLMLAAPGAGKAGSVDLSINMFDWLPSTTARVGVGIYKAGPVIYTREMY
jgi:hypothetical protein